MSAHQPTRVRSPAVVSFYASSATSQSYLSRVQKRSRTPAASAYQSTGVRLCAVVSCCASCATSEFDSTEVTVHKQNQGSSWFNSPADRSQAAFCHEALRIYPNLRTQLNKAYNKNRDPTMLAHHTAGVRFCAVMRSRVSTLTSGPRSIQLITRTEDQQR